MHVPTGHEDERRELGLVAAHRQIAALLSVRDFPEGQYIVMATRKGVIKKTPLSAFSNVRTVGIIALSIDEGDDLFAVRRSDGNKEIFIATRKGKSIRFVEANVRPMGRTARGVRGIRLVGDDDLIEMEVLEGRVSPLGKLVLLTPKTGIVT